MTIVKEQFANAWATTLAATMTINQTTVTLASVAGLPATGQMRFLLGSNSAGEKILVQLDGTSTPGCTRGIEGTTATTHASGEAVTAILTAGGLDNLADHARASIITHQGAVIVHDGEVVWH